MRETGERRYRRIRDRESGIEFIFKYDADDREILRIFARHLSTPDEAIETFFAGETRWHEGRQQHESYTNTHGLFWFWLHPDKVVMGVSCFRR